jgi:hypothetical protein
VQGVAIVYGVAHPGRFRDTPGYGLENRQIKKPSD